MRTGGKPQEVVTMPVLMPIIELEREDEPRRPDARDQQTMDVAPGRIVAFDEAAVRVCGASMEEAVLAAVDEVWRLEAKSETTENMGGELVVADHAVFAPGSETEPKVLVDGELRLPMEPEPVETVESAEVPVVESQAVGIAPPVTTSEEGESGSGGSGEDDEQLKAVDSSEGFSVAEEAFFDGYVPEESLDEAELSAMFDVSVTGRRPRSRGGAPGRSGRRVGRHSLFSLFSFLG